MSPKRLSLLDRFCKYVGWLTSEQRSQIRWNVAYESGVLAVNEARVQSGSFGAMCYDIPARRVKQLWQDLLALDDGGAYFQGMRNRLEELGYFEPDSKAALIAEIKAEYEPFTQNSAERTRAFYRLVTREPLMDTETFIREFHKVFYSVETDTPEYNATLQRMTYDREWISSQKKDFQQYNKFANRNKTLDVFFSENGAGIS